MNRKIIIAAVAILALCAVVAVAIAEGTIVENWRMRSVAIQLERTSAFREAYGSDCSVTLLESGPQPASCFHMRVYHNTPFLVQCGGVDKTVWVRWSNCNQGFDVRVHEFTEEEHTPYTTPRP